MSPRRLAGVALASALASCGAPSPVASRGAGRAIETGAFALVASDYRSTNVALRDAIGDPLTRSLLSTASAAAGVSFALSGDVVVPSEPLARGGDVVLVDRYGTNVITFVDPVSGSPRAQLPVGTGFESNPHDYLEIAPGRALVTRFGTDPRPGDVTFDGGDDVLVIDTAAPRIVARVALPLKAGVPARPGALTPYGGRVYVNLHRLAADFDRAVDGDLAVLDRRSGDLEAVVTLPGSRNCGKPAFASDGRVAFACSGLFDPPRARFDPTGAAVVVGRVDGGRFVTEARWDAAALGLAPTGNVAWLDGDTLLFTAYGEGARGDGLFAVRPGEASPTRLEASVRPFAFGPLRCTDAPARRCATPDADASSVVSVTPGTPPRVARRAAPDVTGRPLRDLVFFR